MSAETKLCICGKNKKASTDISTEDIKVLYGIAAICMVACLVFARVVSVLICGILLVIIIRLLFGHKIYCSARYSAIMPLRILQYF
jgi:hypothetical protein